MSSSAHPALVNEVSPLWINESAAKMERELVTRYGDSQRARIQGGLRQVAEFWRQEDGEASIFEEFARANFAGDQATLDTMFNRLERLLEQLGGHARNQSRVPPANGSRSGSGPPL